MNFYLHVPLHTCECTSLGIYPGLEVFGIVWSQNIILFCHRYVWEKDNVEVVETTFTHISSVWDFLFSSFTDTWYGQTFKFAQAQRCIKGHHYSFNIHFKVAIIKGIFEMINEVLKCLHKINTTSKILFLLFEMIHLNDVT